MTKLPEWLADERAAVAREAAPYRCLSFEERWHLTAAACRAAARQLANRADRERILAYRDPLPESSLTALRRLQAEFRQRR